MGGAESKAAHAGLLERFTQETLSIQDDGYWSALFDSEIPLSELSRLLPQDAIRLLRHKMSPNLHIFFQRVLAELSQIIDIGLYQQLTQELSSRALTCVRLLARVMPVLLEVKSPGGRESEKPGMGDGEWDPDAVTEAEASFVYRLLWTRKGGSPKNPVVSPEEAQGKPEEKILAIQVISSLQKLLFLRGFCVSSSVAPLTRDEPLPKHKVDSRLIWKGGIGAPPDTSMVSTAQQIRNRTEVLRCLLLCSCSTLPTALDELQSGPVTLWLYGFTRGYIPFTANLYCSLMSTVFSDETGSSGILSSNRDYDALVDVSLQLLCVLVDFCFTLPSTAADPAPSEKNSVGESVESHESSGTKEANSSGPKTRHIPMDARPIDDWKEPNRAGGVVETERQPSANVPVRNAYRLMLSGIRRESELTLIANTVMRLLTHATKVRGPGVLGSQGFAGYRELLIMVWHTITLNSTFLRHITARGSANQLLHQLLLILQSTSSARATDVSSSVVSSAADQLLPPSQEKAGLLHLCSFLLLVLSSEREFAVGLNADFNEKFGLPHPPFRGCYADLLIIVSHRVILDSLGGSSGDSLIDMLLTIICNVSAYVKTLCLESSLKLLHLLRRFSKPSYLFQESYRYHNVYFLLDIINNIVQYQYEGNLCLIYSMLRQKDLILDLQNLQLLTSDTIGEGGDLQHKAESEDTARIGPSRAEDVSSRQWRPTQDWFLRWKSKMPIHTSVRLISCLLPMVEAECQEKGLINQTEVLDFLKKTTMVGLLPVPHAIIIRNYHHNTYTALWFTTYTWSIIVSRLSAGDEAQNRGRHTDPSARAVTDTSVGTTTAN